MIRWHGRKSIAQPKISDLPVAYSTNEEIALGDLRFKLQKSGMKIVEN